MFVKELYHSKMEQQRQLTNKRIFNKKILCDIDKTIGQQESGRNNTLSAHLQSGVHAAEHWIKYTVSVSVI